MSGGLEPDDVGRVLAEAAAGPVDGNFDTLFGRAVRSRRRWRAVTTLAAAIAVAAVIAVPVSLVSRSSTQRSLSEPTPKPSITTTGSMPLKRADPLRLIGHWSVRGDGRPSGETLILGTELDLTTECGELSGSWEADPSGLFVGEISTFSQRCAREQGPSPAADWIAQVAAFRIRRGRPVLLDRTGGVVATLAPEKGLWSEPRITPLLRRQLRLPAALPPAVPPASLVSLRGRWQGVESRSVDPKAYVEFGSRFWEGSDGCNGYGGRLAVGAGGDIVTTSGASTLINCAGSPAPSWVIEARRVGLDGADLVLYDADGHLLGRLAREPTGVLHGTFQRVGGPAALPPAPLDGTITIHQGSATGRIVATTRASRGRYRVAVPPGGPYLAVGSTRQVRINGKDAVCVAAHGEAVGAHQSVREDVYCSIR